MNNPGESCERKMVAQSFGRISMDNVLIDAIRLEIFITDIYLKSGLSPVDSATCARLMVKTNLWGIDSHGVLRLPIYATRLRTGAVNRSPSLHEIQGQGTPTGVLDGDNGLGYLVARAGMALACEKAAQFGIGIVSAVHSNHFGAASLFTTEAADKGFIAFATTNVIPNIGMKGALKPCIGNNPIAMAAPTDGDFPFSLDISLSAVAGGKLLLATKKGEKIPRDWAVTREGLETDDPTEGFKGYLLPVGLHKGYGLALFVDILTGVMSGGPFLDDLKSMYSAPNDGSGTTHVFVVIDPARFAEGFTGRMKEWVARIKSVPVADGNQALLIPGEIEFRKEQERRLNGIPLPSDLLDDLALLASDLGLDFPFRQ